jgi:hypothetical protein
VADFDSLEWLREVCAEHKFEPVAVFCDRIDGEGSPPQWPMVVDSPAHLISRLRELGYFSPLPREPAALANVIEVSVTSYIRRRAEEAGLGFTLGRERSYPDIELYGPVLGNDIVAVDVKVARRRSTRSKNTQSRITLYTGNTYFKHPSIKWNGILRPFDNYSRHLDIVVLYEHDKVSESGVANLELIVHDAWRIASRQRSSTTREYIGAVQSVEALRQGKGEFASQEEFYKFWRAYNFKVGRSVSQQLERHLRKQPSA